jgi:hypothetical protein
VNWVRGFAVPNLNVGEYPVIPGGGLRFLRGLTSIVGYFVGLGFKDTRNLSFYFESSSLIINGV